MKAFLNQEKKDIKEIWQKLKKRDFKGYSGIAIKNSTYQFLTNVFSKGGSLIFTVILARMLLPELFGLYSLALSTIMLFIGFADLGIGSALVNFVSKSFGENNPKKAKNYVFYLLKIQIFLIIVVSIFLVASSKFISENYYQKPLFLALLAGSLYILFRQIITFTKALFQSLNNFRVTLFLEIFFQITRIIIIPLTILISLKYALENGTLVFFIILALALSWFLVLVFIFLFFKKKLNFLNAKTEKINKEEKTEIKRYILPLSTIAFSGVFFGYIDMVVLGRFVLSEFIGYYRAAFSIVGAIAPLVVFSNIFFPIFSRIKGERLENAFKKSMRMTFLFSLTLAILVFITSPLIVQIIFGKEYSIAVPLLRILSITILLFPVENIHLAYLLSKRKTGVIVKLLIMSTIINIGLNYLFVIWLINYSLFVAVVGVCVATILSKSFYFLGLVWEKNKLKNLTILEN